MCRVRLALTVVASLVIFSSTAYSQASITGVVRDTSGAMLPGVTVEASSPALIEKVRSVVSDGSGQVPDSRTFGRRLRRHLYAAGVRHAPARGIQLAGSSWPR